ncbi:MAG: sigma-54-dependent Fis family transcriptional regulator [Halobacteriovoraceae bacterium]|nr:sigma-54-dependent Fis family transcriptional regulator [Halobacteriovoraceae bacterium]MCB9095933.1 sigma-54-dependent Fis family transcriptional regulator [Halobacteriovoraceae bacterium]
MDDLNYLAHTYDSTLENSNLFAENDQKIIFCDRPYIVILEDDRALSSSIKIYLEKFLNAEVLVFHNGTDFLEKFVNNPLDEPFCLLADISLGAGYDGLFLLDLLNEKKTKFFSIVMTGFASIETAITATKKGVYHYLTKPFELENLNKLVIEGFAQKLKTIIKDQKLIEDSSSLSPLHSLTSEKLKTSLPEVTDEDVFASMIGRSTAMKLVFDRIKKVAKSKSTILITGESGTGKELVAKAIHQLSQSSENSLVSINCAAIPRDLLESELFGHVKGAFTGAVSNRKGKFELANNTTIFLDEIGDMPVVLQVKLLRVLQSRQIEPVGSCKVFEINTRVIAATHKNLEDAVREGSFREDLFYRLNVIPITIPALRDRKEDIPLLISFFLKKYVSADRSNMIEFSTDAFNLLLSYNWPGNVRELENVIERLVILKGGAVIMPQDLPTKIFKGNPLTNLTYKSLFELPEEGVLLKKILSDIEDSLIVQALEKTKGNKNKASKLLGLNRTTLIEKIKKKNLIM